MTGLLFAVGANEVRALFPTWIICVVTMAAAGASGSARGQAVGLVVGAVGSIVLGTQLFGLEFGNRTFAVLLSQPLARRTLLLIKMSVLATLVLSLGAVASTYAPGPSSYPPAHPIDIRIAVLFMLCGLFVAPCLTLLTGSGIAGLVFSIAVASALTLGCEVVPLVQTGISPEEVDALRRSGLWWGILVTSVSGAVGTCWVFATMEQVERQGGRVRSADWLSRPGRSRTVGAWLPAHRTIQLLRKELHLQQMTFVVAVLFLVACGGLALLQSSTSQSRPDLVESVTTLYLLMLGVVAGAVPSAEERHLRTLESQLLLPMSAGTQWALKSAVALGLVLGLGVGLPWLVLPATDSAGWWARLSPLVAVWLPLLTSFSLFVSSLCRNGVRAILAAILATIAAAVAFEFVNWAIFITIAWWARSWGWLHFPMLWGVWTHLLAAGTVSALLLQFGSTNHRAAQPRWPQLMQQLGVLGAVGILLLLFVTLARSHWYPLPT